MKKRLATLALPLLLLGVPAGAAAQTPAPEPQCVILGSFLLGGTTCDPDATRLAAAQAQWDAIAGEIGVAATRLWWGPRPKTLADVWWM